MKRSFKFLSLLLLLLSLSLYGKETKKSFLGKAYKDKERKILLYTEKHTAFYQDGVLQKSTNDYFDPEGKKFAELNSDYTMSVLLPTYSFRDFRKDHEEGVLFEDGEYFIYKKEKNKSLKKKKIKKTENLFSCQGWHYYLIENLKEIEEKALKMRLIFPSKLDYYFFRAKSKRSDENSLTIRLEFQNWFIRLFAPYLEITYDKKSKNIKSFYGASNILTDKGKLQNVYIDYSES